jgi:hypothetical protein
MSKSTQVVVGTGNDLNKEWMALWIRLLSVLVFVVNDIALLPIFDPICNTEDLHLAVCGRTDDPVDPRVDDHLFTDKTRERIDGRFLSVDLAIDIHVPAEKAHACTGSVDDGILFGVYTPTQLIPLAVGNVQFVSQAGSVLEAILCFSRGSYVSRGNDLIVPDDDRPDRTAEAGTSL